MPAPGGNRQRQFFSSRRRRRSMPPATTLSLSHKMASRIGFFTTPIRDPARAAGGIAPHEPSRSYGSQTEPQTLAPPDRQINRFRGHRFHPKISACRGHGRGHDCDANPNSASGLPSRGGGSPGASRHGLQRSIDGSNQLHDHPSMTSCTSELLGMINVKPDGGPASEGS